MNGRDSIDDMIAATTQGEFNAGLARWWRETTMMTFIGGPRDGETMQGHVTTGCKLLCRLSDGSGLAAVYLAVGDELRYEGEEESPMGPLEAAVRRQSLPPDR